MNFLKQRIYGCTCKQCKAIVRLLDECGAILIISPNKGGRLCEVAVVAATGSSGMDENDIVSERRKYAEHLGITLSGPVSNSDKPIHIKHGINNSNHEYNAKHRINLGIARIIYEGTRYRITV